jgi:prephenate dehydrogenase
MKLAIVGLGLIGGSMALDLKAAGFATTVVGVDGNPDHAEKAKLLGLVEITENFDLACSTADIIVIATPVHSISKLLPLALDKMKPGAVITDVGSTKKQISDAVENHSKRNQYVPSHPMAGTEFSGPAAAHLGLFKGKAVVICDEAKSSTEAVKIIRALYEALQMRLITMESEQHDLHAAYVSHLSHITSFVLANTVLDKEKDIDAIFNLASGGFESTVRLAKSSPDMWAPIFEQNNVFITEALGAYIERLRRFHDSLKSRDFKQTRTYMEQANEITRVLAQIGSVGKNHDKT